MSGLRQLQGRALTDAVTALPGDRVRVSFKAPWRSGTASGAREGDGEERPPGAAVMVWWPVAIDVYVRASAPRVVLELALALSTAPRSGRRGPGCQLLPR